MRYMFIVMIAIPARPCLAMEKERVVKEGKAEEEEEENGEEEQPEKVVGVVGGSGRV